MAKAEVRVSLTMQEADALAAVARLDTLSRAVVESGELHSVVAKALGAIEKVRCARERRVQVHQDYRRIKVNR